MSETTNENPPGGGGQEQTDDLARVREALDKERRLRKEAEGRAKSNDDAARRLAELEESQKTESQKLAERLAQAEGRAAKAERAALVARIASDKGVPAKALVGDDEDALIAHADELIAWRDAAKTTTSPPPQQRRPPRSGVTTGEDNLTGKDRAAAALRALRATAG